MKLMLILAWRYLWGRRLRTVLSTLSLMLGVAIIFSTQGLKLSITKTLQESRRSSAPRFDLVAGLKSGGFFSEKRGEAIRGLSGVARANPVFERLIYLPGQYALGSGNARIDRLAVHGWRIDGTLHAVSPRLVAGRRFRPGDRNVLLIQDSLATKSGLSIGDSIKLPSARGVTVFRLIGILANSPVIGHDELTMPLRAAQDLFQQPGRINALIVELQPDRNKQSMRRLIGQSLGPGFRVGGGGEDSGEWEAVLKRADMVFAVISFLALAMGGFILFNTFRTAFAERKRDIGLLRTVGATRRNVLTVLLFEGLLQGGGGVLIGIPVGYILGRVSIRILMMNSIMQNLQLNLDIPFFTPQAVAITVALGLGIPLLSALLPAFTAIRTTPLEALRPSEAISSGTTPRKRARLCTGMAMMILSPLALFGNAAVAAAGLLLFIAGIVTMGPTPIQPFADFFNRMLASRPAVAGRMAGINLARQPRRTSITASTIMMGLMILLGASGIMTTITHGFLTYFEHSIKADYIVLPHIITLDEGNVGAGPGLATRLR
ncbi:MAG: FtsX-like permease family protein, partial [Proteobacteria bacterium]|nr:FtsX-like permease family protein [Pseudomonadota bacterium]